MISAPMRSRRYSIPCVRRFRASSSTSRTSGAVGPNKRWSLPTTHRCCAGSRQPAQHQESLTIFFKAARPNDQRPLYCLNQVGVPKRPEIKAGDFAKALDDKPIAVIPFEPQLFGSAANNGQMIAEISANHRTADILRQLAQKLTGRIEPKKKDSSLLSTADREALLAKRDPILLSSAALCRSLPVRVLVSDSSYPAN